MKEDYINYEVAKLAKEAGFRWPVEKAYRFKDRIDAYYGYCNQDKSYYSVCSQAVLAKWIREEFDLLIRCYFDEESLKFEPCYTLINLKTGNEFGLSAKQLKFKTYEEAIEESLKRTLEFIINRNKQNEDI